MEGVLVGRNIYFDSSEFIIMLYKNNLFFSRFKFDRRFVVFKYMLGGVFTFRK